VTQDSVTGTRRLTVAQALVRFLSVQYSERDGVEHRLIEGCFGIFGHGNLAGIGQALLESELAAPGVLPYRQSRNEQAMVHTAAAYARMRSVICSGVPTSPARRPRFDTLYSSSETCDSSCEPATKSR